MQHRMFRSHKLDAKTRWGRGKSRKRRHCPLSIRRELHPRTREALRLHSRSAEVSAMGILNIMALFCYVRYTGARGFNRKEGSHKTQGGGGDWQITALIGSMPRCAEPLRLTWGALPGLNQGRREPHAACLLCVCARLCHATCRTGAVPAGCQSGLFSNERVMFTL